MSNFDLEYLRNQGLDCRLKYEHLMTMKKKTMKVY